MHHSNVICYTENNRAFLFSVRATAHLLKKKQFSTVLIKDRSRSPIVEEPEPKVKTCWLRRVLFAIDLPHSFDKCINMYFKFNFRLWRLSLPKKSSSHTIGTRKLWIHFVRIRNYLFRIRFHAGKIEEKTDK